MARKKPPAAPQQQSGWTFISWSGEATKIFASALNRLLKKVIPNSRPWFSEVDIALGTRGIPEISKELERSDFGILCLTPDNFNSPWINFEAGALAKRVDKSRVVPVLVGFKKVTDLAGPLAQFQGILATKTAIKRMVTDTNAALRVEERQDQALVDELFEDSWDALEKAINETTTHQAAKAPAKDVLQLMEEMLPMVRELHSRASHPQLGFHIGPPMPVSFGVLESSPGSGTVLVENTSPGPFATYGKSVFGSSIESPNVPGNYLFQVSSSEPGKKGK